MQRHHQNTVEQGGHDVPPEKLFARFPRTMANLRAAIGELPHVMIFDNDDLAASFRAVAVVHNGLAVWSADRLPEWFQGLLPTD